MQNNKTYPAPSLLKRLLAIWFRHYRVYTKHLFSNGLPPFVEPLIFLAGIGLGLGKFIVSMEGLPYIEFLATGLLVTSSMFTASFECTYGTFIRMEFEEVYTGILASPLHVSNVINGEILWTGTKGFFFSAVVLLILQLFGIITTPLSLLTPFVGFLTGLLFGALALFVTSFVHNINYFNFFFTGFLSPMFFFSGVVFPLSSLPSTIRVLAEFFPLTHAVRLVRALSLSQNEPDWVCSLVFMVLCTLLFAYLANVRLKKRLLD